MNKRRRKRKQPRVIRKKAINHVVGQRSKSEASVLLTWKGKILPFRAVFEPSNELEKANDDEFLRLMTMEARRALGGNKPGVRMKYDWDFRVNTEGGSYRVEKREREEKIK